MSIPEKEIQNLIYGNPIDYYGLKDLCSFDIDDFFQSNKFEEINWLNTPGPIYTCYPDNCGTGVIEASSNVCDDTEFHEFVFKQPINKSELVMTLNAACADPFSSYFFNGGNFWTYDSIRSWWEKHEERLKHIYWEYKKTVEYAKRNDIKHSPDIEVYKNLFKFYQFELKEYLEWYIYNQSKVKVELRKIDFDWSSIK